MEKIAFNKCINLHKEVNRIAQPLFNKSGITWISYTKEFFNGNKVTIANHPEWLENYFTKKYFTANLSDYADFYLSEFILWEHLGQDKQIEDARVNYGIGHGMTLVRYFDKGVELFHFASSPTDQDIVNWYINNLNVLKRFCHYFNEELNQSIIKIPSITAASDQFELKEQFRQLLIAKNKADAEKNCNNIFPKINSYYGVALSKQEINVLTQLLQGRTAKIIARALCLSPRTVESYIQILRKKFKCSNKSELITKILNSSFVKDFSIF